jgi:hypothetical protein
MPQATSTSRRRLPLAFRLSLILMLAAVLPLLVTVIFSETQSRPTLINQANNAMQTDALTRMQSINTYLTERLLDAGTLSQVNAVQVFLKDPTPVQNPTTATDIKAALTYQQDLPHAAQALFAGTVRDKRYGTWALYYANGAPALGFRAPQILIRPQQLTAIPAQYAQGLPQLDKAGLPVPSAVYYNPATQKAFINIDVPIYDGQTPASPYLGFMRAQLNLDYIWNIVQQDKGVNNSGSAFILDQNGVRIADTNGKDLWTSVAPLDPNVQQQVTSQKWYGTNAPVSVQADTKLAGIVAGTDKEDTFTLTPAGQNGQNYQAARATAAMLGSNTTPVVPWNYVVISPSSVVTQVADDQLRNTIIVAIVVALLAVGIGFWVSGLITRPIMRSVDQLRENSEALNVLSKKQQSASSEQLWVVDSIQVGLQSVQYYTDAARIAAHKMGEVGTELDHNWRRQNIETIKQGLQQMVGAAGYIEKATNYQGDSSQKLSTAIKVTTQVNEQLADGAISATEAASQLEQVVNDLRGVIGQ